MNHSLAAFPMLRPRLQRAGLTLLAALIGLFALVAGAQAQQPTREAPRPAGAMPAMFLEDTSPKPLVPTVRAFREAVEAAGWSILGVTNMAGILSERGFTLHPVLVFDACSGRHSFALLSRDETRFVSSMIPCRVAIYQTSTGQVIISRMNAVAMASMIGGPAEAVIRTSGEEMERIIQVTLRQLAAP